MTSVTLDQVNKNVLELKKELQELKKSIHNVEDKGWNLLSEESLREVWDNEKDEKVWQKYL